MTLSCPRVHLHFLPLIVAQQTRTICYGEHLSLEVRSRMGYYSAVCTHEFTTLCLLASHGPVRVTEKNKIYDSFRELCNPWKNCHHNRLANVVKAQPNMLWMAVTKGSRGTVYRARATKPGTPLTGDTTKRGKQLKRRPLLCAVQEFAFPFTPLSDTKRKSLCLTAEWSFTGFLSCSIESFRHMQMEGAL